jgi:hypothetical protein
MHIALRCSKAYHIFFKKFFSLILLLRSFLIAFLNCPLASSATKAPSTDPVSLAGRSILCFVIGIFGSIIWPESRIFSSSLRCCFATLRRTFLDFAGASQHRESWRCVNLNRLDRNKEPTKMGIGRAYRIRPQRHRQLHHCPYSRLDISIAIQDTRVPPALLDHRGFSGN